MKAKVSEKVKTIEYGSFAEAVAAMIEYLKKGVKCKGIGMTTLVVWDD